MPPGETAWVNGQKAKTMSQPIKTYSSVENHRGASIQNILIKMPATANDHTPIKKEYPQTPRRAIKQIGV